MSTRALSPRDLLARERYLFRFSWTMQDYPRREYKRIRRELRAEVTAAAADVGMAAALADLGHPMVLGERYIAELGRRLPRWTTGIVAAALAVAVVIYLFTAYAVGTLDTLEALGGGAVTRYPFGSETTFTFTGQEISVRSSTSWQWAALYVGVAAVAFVTGSRLWRALG
ncbi:hypothetical protein [Cellulomonas sp. KRMCY2]|uniref:hypothetical protein n=1 Tax=Cellulomonas sp. KRMCY2 TaxID=1304865 RepID=UPI00045E93A8|nr:hypothetical protein [Cellulomonas sp. KRMCY2]